MIIILDSTNYILENYPDLQDVIHAYNLKIKLDDFGMGNVVFYENKEIGYWFHSLQNISMQYTIEFGSHTDLHNDYVALGNGMRNRIEELLKRR